MTTRGRALPVGLALTLAVGGLGVAAVVDRSPAPVHASPGFGSLSAHHGDARTDEWREVADVRPGLDPDGNACERGDDECLDAVVAEMQVRLDEIGCGHTGPFAFTYLEMTRGVQRRVAEEGFFEVPEATANFDALFARAYFDAIDNWTAGRREHVPGAWVVAFEAADGGTTSAAADLLLGMNAHIARDLPYIVAAAIEANPALADAPADFVKVNDVIAEVRAPMLRDAAARFDPAIAALDQPLPAIAQAGPGGGGGAVDVIGLWRNHAFDLGRQLALAAPADRPAVAAQIEREAVATASLILNADASDAIAPSAGRDAHCRQQ